MFANNTIATKNGTGAREALCQDLMTYCNCNPISGCGCFFCINWTNTLNNYKRNELLNCPESCDLIDECLMNATELTASSFLKESTDKETHNSIAVAVLSAIAIATFAGLAFLMSRLYNRNATDGDPSVGVCRVKERHECNTSSQSLHLSMAIDEQQDDSNAVELLEEGRCVKVDDNVDQVDKLPTPRLIPELNISIDSTDLSSEENVNECTDNPATVAPCHTKKLSVENKGKSGTVPESIVSPDSIYSVVHLLGSLKSEEDDEDESDISQEM